MDNFIGEIRLVAFDYAPDGWALCNGASMTVAQNQALYALLGTTYGGVVGSSFNLPDLQGRTPLMAGTGPDGITYPVAVKGGVETVALTAANLPPHSHTLNATTATGTKQGPGPLNSSVLGATTGTNNLYGSGASAPMGAGACSAAGDNGAHANMQPSLVLNYIIATTGLWPNRD